MRTFHFIFGTPRCGSTFLQDRLSRAGIGVYEPTGASAFQGIGAGTNPYASLADETHPHLRQHPQCAVVVKEVLDDVLRAYLTSQGHTLTSWVGPALLQQARTVWIFREPSAVWRSIRAQGWDQTYHPFETFKTFYRHAMASYQAMLAAYPTQVGVVTYERLMHNPAAGFREVAQFLGLAWQPQQLEGNETRADYYRRVDYHPAVRTAMEEQDAHRSLAHGPEFGRPKPALSAQEQQQIELALSPVYALAQAADILRGA